MYCNINEAFGSNSHYMKSYINNELNNQKLLEKYKNFDNFFSKEERELQQNLPNNIIEHFTNEKISNESSVAIKPTSSNLVCDKSLDHIINCTSCQKKLIKLYFKNLIGNFSLDNKNHKDLVSLGLVIILFILAVKIIIKL